MQIHLRYEIELAVNTNSGENMEISIYFGSNGKLTHFKIMNRQTHRGKLQINTFSNSIFRLHSAEEGRKAGAAGPNGSF